MTHSDEFSDQEFEETHQYLSISDDDVDQYRALEIECYPHQFIKDPTTQNIENPLKTKSPNPFPEDQGDSNSNNSKTDTQSQHPKSPKAPTPSPPLENNDTPLPKDVPISHSRALLPKLEGPYNRFNSFESSCDHVLIFKKLKEIMSNERLIDFGVTEKRFMIRGRKFYDFEECEFQINLFQMDKKDVTLVEFQKRSGEPFVFQNFYESCLNELRKSKLVDQDDKVEDNDLDLDLDLDLLPLEDLGLSMPPMMALNSFSRPLPFEMEETEDEKNELDFAREIWENLVKGYADLKKNAATIFARKCEAEKGRNIFTKVTPNLVKKSIEIIESCLDAQVVFCIGCSLFHLMLHDHELRNHGKEKQKEFESIIKKWEKTQNINSWTKIIPSQQIVNQMKKCCNLFK